jgi:hypothetical protein
MFLGIETVKPRNVWRQVYGMESKMIGETLLPGNKPAFSKQMNEK